jgi:hypothetical protein
MPVFFADIQVLQAPGHSGLSYTQFGSNLATRIASREEREDIFVLRRGEWTHE